MNLYKRLGLQHYLMDLRKSWQDRYRELERHHIEETTILIDEIHLLEAKVQSLQLQVDNLEIEIDIMARPS